MGLSLPPSDLAVLQRLRLAPRKKASGRVRGSRLTRQKGVSLEFADFRDYTEGDDLRHLDWNALARFDSAVVRTYLDEQDLALYLLLDDSASMDFGSPPKLASAQMLALALGFVALGGQEAVKPKALGRREGRSPTWRGRAATVTLSRWLESVQATSSIGLAEGIRNFLSSAERPGVAALITDGLDPQFADLIAPLASRGHEVWVLQVLSREEIDPDIEGDLKLIDAESGEFVEITASGSAIESYKGALATHNDKIAEACRRVGARRMVIESSTDVVSNAVTTWIRDGWMQR